jgi:mono/diheme cytochrome c family protein
MKYFCIIHLCLAALLGAMPARAEIIPPAATSNAAHPLVWDAMEKKQELPGMTNVAYFTFWVTNKSAANVVMESVDADCECTVVEAKTAFPWKLEPAAGGPLNVRVNIRGRYGPFIKSMIIHSSAGPQMLTVNMQIPLTPAPSNVSVRQRDVMAAKADRQALFRGSCAVCHTAPTVGLTGAALFQKACGICHQAEVRADFVPDLAALTHPMDADHWRKWITSGKAGTLMPAFAASEGGILDTNQIESLVKFVLQKFPSDKASAVKQSTSTSQSK